MKKNFIKLIIPLSLSILIVGCGNNSNNSSDTIKTKNLLTSDNSDVKSNTASKKSDSNAQASKLKFEKDLTYYNPFIFHNDDLYFCNTVDNNRISVIPGLL